MNAAAGEKVALLFGGTSPEREVSLQSAAGVAAALQELGITPLRVDPAVQQDWLAHLLTHKVQRVFNILHGGSGENGEVRGALNCAGIACTGSDVLGSAMAMNKDITKAVWRSAGIPTAEWRVVSDAAQAARIVEELPPPWFVKPVCGGSSTASTAATDLAQLQAAVETANAEGSGALVERHIRGGEYTLSILDGKPLPLIRIVPAQPFYDYHAKYISDETQFLCPCGLPAAQERALAQQAMRAFEVLQCSHWGRVDFILDESGAPFFLEVNTVPGMTSHSLVPLAAKQAGLDYAQVVARILHSAGGGDD